MNKTLFELDAPVAPEDASRGPKAKKRVSRPVEAEKPLERILEAPAPTINAEIIGGMDDGFLCGDLACRGTAGDIVAEDAGHWLVSCCFCCTAKWVRIPKGKRLESGKEFVFRGGQHDGQTIAQVLAAGGERYLRWAAESHPRQFVREQVKNALDAMGR